MLSFQQARWEAWNLQHAAGFPDFLSQPQHTGPRVAVGNLFGVLVVEPIQVNYNDDFT